MEDTRSHESCTSCGAALQTADIEWLNERDEGKETEFELEIEPDERAAIVDALMKENIRHRWEGNKNLVVAETVGDHVDEILDEILGIDEDDDDDEGDDEVDENEDLADMDIMLDADPYGTASEDGYDLLSNLFIATGKVLRSRNDADDVDEFIETSNAVLSSPTPFGIEEEMWADIQSTARNTSVAIQQDSEAPVDGDLKALHNILQQLV